MSDSWDDTAAELGSAMDEGFGYGCVFGFLLGMALTAALVILILRHP